MERLARRTILLGSLAVTLVAVLSSGASGAPVRFSTVTHGTHAPAYPNELFGKPWALVAPNIVTATVFEKALSKPETAKLEAVDYEAYFVIGVVVAERTSGYSVTIRRITLQRISRSKRQFCIIVDYQKPRPGQAVLQELVYAEHTARLSARPFQIDRYHWAIPTRWVLRGTDGKLLGTSTVGPPGALRPDAKASVCRV